MSKENNLEMALWLIEKYIDLRGSIANRAAIVLSSDALLLAGQIFLIDKILSDSQTVGVKEQAILLVCTGISLLLSIISISFATTGIASVWRFSRERFGKGMPSRLFFHAFDTVKEFETFSSFSEQFQKTDKEQMLTYALGYLWSNENLYNYRYYTLRRAIKLFFFASIVFVLSITLLIFFSFL